MSDPVTVSIVVPTYNRPAFLAEALRSLAGQTYRAFEAIVVNDAGADVQPVIREFAAAMAVVYREHPANRGLAAARNTALAAAQGRYIAYLDDDDRYYPDHLQTLVGFLQQNPGRVAYTDAVRACERQTGSSRTLVRREPAPAFDFDRDRLLLGNYIPVLCVMHEKSCLDAVGGFDESLSSHEDWDLWIRMAQRFPFAHIPEVTAEISWREDGTTMTSGHRADMLRTTRIIYRKHAALVQDRPDLRAAQRANVRKTALSRIVRSVPGLSSVRHRPERPG